MILLLTVLLFSSNHLIKAYDSENSGGWWSGATGYLSNWYSSEEPPEDNNEEIENSLKLMELFPTLKEQLNSEDENVKKEAEEFIQKMNAEMKEQKRYTNVIWNGVQRIIDMGKVESHERRSNEKEVNILLQLLYRFVDFIKYLLGVSTDKGKDKDNEKHDKEMNDVSKEKHPTDDKKLEEEKLKNKDDKPADDHDTKTKSEPVKLKDNVEKSMIEAETHEIQHTVKPLPRPVDHELSHRGPFPTEQTPPPTIPDAGRKHKGDKLKPNDPEFQEPSTHDSDDEDELKKGKEKKDKDGDGKKDS